MCGVERGWEGELGFSVTLVVVCSAPCKTLTRVWDGAEVGRGGGLLSHFGGSVQCAS